MLFLISNWIEDFLNQLLFLKFNENDLLKREYLRLFEEELFTKHNNNELLEKHTKLEELIDFKTNYCDKFFPSNLATWSTVVLLECSKDRELMEEIKGYVVYWSVDKRFAAENTLNKRHSHKSCVYWFREGCFFKRRIL